MPRISSAGAITPSSMGAVTGSVTAPLRYATSGPPRMATRSSEATVGTIPSGSLRRHDAGLERGQLARLHAAVLEASGRGVKGGLELGRDEVLEVVERGEPHVIGRDVELDATGGQLARGRLDDHVRDVLLELLLSAHHDALVVLRGRDELVDVDADAVDARIAGSLERTVAGL